MEIRDRRLIGFVIRRWVGLLVKGRSFSRFHDSLSPSLSLFFGNLWPRFDRESSNDTVVVRNLIISNRIFLFRVNN